jgi:hypothetical protein
MLNLWLPPHKRNIKFINMSSCEIGFLVGTVYVTIPGKGEGKSAKYI